MKQKRRDQKASGYKNYKNLHFQPSNKLYINISCNNSFSIQPLDTIRLIRIGQLGSADWVSSYHGQKQHPEIVGKSFLSILRFFPFRKRLMLSAHKLHKWMPVDCNQRWNRSICFCGHGRCLSRIKLVAFYAEVQNVYRFCYRKARARSNNICLRWESSFFFEWMHLTAWTKTLSARCGIRALFSLEHTWSSLWCETARKFLNDRKFRIISVHTDWSLLASHDYSVKCLNTAAAGDQLFQCHCLYDSLSLIGEVLYCLLYHTFWALYTLKGRTQLTLSCGEKTMIEIRWWPISCIE